MWLLAPTWRTSPSRTGSSKTAGVSSWGVAHLLVSGVDHRQERMGPPTRGPPMSRFPVPDRSDLPDDLRARIDEVEERSGFVPNVFLTLAHRPDEWRAFFAYHDALMDKETPGLTKADRELVVVATSAENRCLYCVVAHGAIARVRARNPRIADQVATDWRKAELDDRQRAVLEVAVRFAVEPWTVTPEHLAGLHGHGLTDDDVWDLGSIAAFFAMSNRLVHLAGTMPNEEFYLMGRQPRQG